jgi:hypothetical protein
MGYIEHSWATSILVNRPSPLIDNMFFLGDVDHFHELWAPSLQSPGHRVCFAIFVLSDALNVADIARILRSKLSLLYRIDIVLILELTVLKALLIKSI